MMKAFFRACRGAAARFGGVVAIGLIGFASISVADAADDEAIIFTPPGRDRPGEPRVASGRDAGRLVIKTLDAETGKPTPCRINVVGGDGGFYQPRENDLSPFSLTGEWPKVGKGNRVGKAPIRYFGRFFYSDGSVEVPVPAGRATVEVWKGFEYRPVRVPVVVSAGRENPVSIRLERSVLLGNHGYISGDPHIHIPRKTDADDALIFKLMRAEDIKYATLLAYNEPAGPYDGRMETLDSPQFRGLGKSSIKSSEGYHIISGQEYRSGTYGHLNLFLRDDLALAGSKHNANDSPPYGEVGRDTIDKGGYAFYAHGGYAQSIYADFVQKNVNAVELLQFGVYRGIELADWYRILNIGYRFPIVGACDYPACRKLGDCVTFARLDGGTEFADWMKSASEGKSFVSTGPITLIEADGARPGDVIERKGADTRKLKIKARSFSEVAPVTNLQVIVGGKVVAEKVVGKAEGLARVIELNAEIDAGSSTWIAARAFSTATTGSPDAESHTNPIYVHVDGKAPYDPEALDRLLEKLDGQAALHRKRTFPGKASVLDYFQKSRDVLLRIRREGGLPSSGVPRGWLEREVGLKNDPSARTHTEEELKAFLKPLPALAPEAALKTFETAKGFHMELIAAEPLVVDPVAAAYDENGQLYVAEMRDYPYLPKPGAKPLGTVRLLRDLDGDGDFDESHVFADELLWAAGIAPWKGGVFVAASPDVWYLKDTDGDFRADLRIKVFTGFGTQNQQGMVNNLVFGLDHKIYGATSVNGGIVKRGDDPKSRGVSLNGRDFCFDPRALTIEPITGSIQFGNTFDDWGNRFLCSESRPLMHEVLPERYLARNPYLQAPAAIQNVGGQPVPIFRISPVERWRMIRSSRRIAHGERSAEAAGASHHVVDAAAGVTVYRGGAYPPEFHGQVFVGDAQNNLIHRRRLIPDGATFKSERVDANMEFVRSSDNWFRPVNFVNAPDGTLAVLDMSREILEAIHIPNDVVKHLDLKSGRDQGRIYRIAPDGFRSPPPPRLGGLATPALVEELESPHSWRRDTAHRLLFERQDSAVAGSLRNLQRLSKSPQARVLALWSLHGLGSLADDDVLAALGDAEPGVRENAVRLAEPRLDVSPRIFEAVLEKATDESARVRFQTALSLGESRNPRAVDALIRIAGGGDGYLAAAALSSLGTEPAVVLGRLSSNAGLDAFLPIVGDSLAQTIGARNRPEEVRGVIRELARRRARPRGDSVSQRLFESLAKGLRRVNGRFPVSDQDPDTSKDIRERLGRARSLALDPKVGESARVAAIALLELDPDPESTRRLSALLAAEAPVAVRLAAIDALSKSSEPRVASELLDRLDAFGPSLQAAAIRVLLSREAWSIAFLKYVENHREAAARIDSNARSLLLAHRNPEVSRLAKSAFGESLSKDRAALIAEYLPTIKLPSKPDRGREVFRNVCANCHKIGDVGFSVGPDITSTANRDPEALLTHILDPNRYVLPNYVQYIVSDVEGRVFTGLVASENSSGVTLKQEAGKLEAIPRDRIDEMRASGKSLMPEDLDKKLDKQAMADLLAFLLTARPPSAGEGPLDVGTIPGLIEPE